MTCTFSKALHLFKLFLLFGHLINSHKLVSIELIVDGNKCFNLCLMSLKNEKKATEKKATKHKTEKARKNKQFGAQP